MRAFGVKSGAAGVEKYREAAAAKIKPQKQKYTRQKQPEKGEKDMNVEGIGINQYAWNSDYRVSRRTGAVTTFDKTMENVVNKSKGNVIHGLWGGKTQAGDTVVGAWADASANTSVTVYQPKDFDESNPVYKMKIWDSEGNVTERSVNLKDVNPWKSDAFDMYAYSCYASNSGKYDSAVSKYMGTYAQYADGLKGGSSYYSMMQPMNWLSAVSSIMNTQYGLGNMSGYMGYKGYYDFLSGGNLFW